MNEIDIVRDISRKFEQAGIAYMLTGSMAMNYYAQPRMTRDIDVVVAIGPENIERIAALFRPEYYVSEENIRESIAHESVFNLIHHESVIKVDCMRARAASTGRWSLSGDHAVDPGFHDFYCEQGRPDHFKTFLGERFALGAPTWRREEPAATGYDAGYLQRWTRELGLDTLLQECLHD